MNLFQRLFSRQSRIASLLSRIETEKSYDARKKLAEEVFSSVSPEDSKLLQEIVVDQRRKGNTREVAATALGKLKDPAALEVLKGSLVDDQNSYVRGAAAEALGEIGGTGVVDLLLSRYDRDSDVSSQIASAFGKAGDDRAIEPLSTRLRRADDLVERVYIIQAIEKIGGQRAIQALRRIALAGVGDATEEMAVKKLDQMDPSWRDSSERKASAVVQENGERTAAEDRERTAEWHELWPPVSRPAGHPPAVKPFTPKLKDAVAVLAVLSTAEIRDAIARVVQDKSMWPKHWLFRMRRCHGPSDQVLPFIQSLLSRYESKGKLESVSVEPNGQSGWFNVSHLFIGIVTNWPIVPMLIIRPSASELCCMYFEPED